METRSPLEPGAAIVPRERGIPRSGDSSEVAANKSLPFVHTARRYYRLNDRARPSDRSALTTTPCVSRLVGRKDRRARPFRGSKSRNKVSVGEPADGSFAFGKIPAARSVIGGTVSSDGAHSADTSVYRYRWAAGPQQSEELARGRSRVAGRHG